MIHDTDLFSTKLFAREPTEDGDWLYHFEVTAKGFAGILAYNEERSNQVTPFGHALAPLEDWTGVGNGKLVATYINYIDGVEIAIEAANDARCFMEPREDDLFYLTCG